jgi:antimicrobial peptide system SdpA family protein
MDTEKSGSVTSSKSTTCGDRRLGLLVLALGAFWAVLFTYAVHGSMPFNPLRLPFENKLQTMRWIPEGWKFFTRDPREEDLLYFVVGTSGVWVSAHRGPHSRPSNALGLNRVSRAQSVEAGLLYSKIPKTLWAQCNGHPVKCLESSPVGKALKNISPRPTLCGTIGLVMQKPVPWAWSHSRDAMNMPSRVIRLEVSC